MKKNLVFGISACVAVVGMLFSSCNPTPSAKVELKNEVDSLSYAFGASVAENLDGGLQQAGIIADTLNVTMQYASKIQAETDDAKKAILEKEKRTKIDSIKKANDYAIAEFLIGFEQGMNARKSENPRNMGLSFGNQVAQQGLPNVVAQFYSDAPETELNKKAITAAVVAAVQKKSPVFANASSYIMMKSQENQQKMMEKEAKKGETNRIEGEKFLDANKSKDGVVALASGVQYKVLTEGNGPKPKATDQVTCHYHGTLLDGTVFDSSVQRGTPATFPVGGVIPGWIEILQLMPVGSKWEVYIPYNMAYGEQGTGREIGPYATLIFQIELLEIASGK